MFRGSAVAEQNTVYCISRDSHTVYCYEVNKDEWQKHSECPHSNTGLAIIRGVLTAIGGQGRSGKTNKLLSWKNPVWEEVFPPMNTARYYHAVVSDGHYVIAVGGDDSETSVELFDISCNTWSTVTSLPRPLSSITATVCGGQLYVMNSYDRIYYTSIANFKEASTQPFHLQPTWLPLPNAPVQGSTLSTMCGAVVAVGGMRFTAISDIHQLHGGEWVRIGHMDTARHQPIVAVLPGDRMVVVGSYNWFRDSTAVELAVVC